MASNNPKLLELFKGSGSVGKVAITVGYDVVSIDLDPIYTPDIETDILKWDYKKFSKENNYIPDYIWASPPCNTFSPLVWSRKPLIREIKTAKPLTSEAVEGTNILYKTLEIINYFNKLNPNLCFCIENPRGMMRNDPNMMKLPYRSTTLYCYYGGKKFKPTDFWSNYPLGLKEVGGAFDWKQIKKDCENYQLLIDTNKITDRYSIPPKLIKQIIYTSIINQK